MEAQASLIRELEESIRDGSHSQRVNTLRRVTDLFVDRAEQYDSEQVVLFDSVIGRLAAEIEKAALAELAGRLAPIANAPAETVGKLARDEDIEVAGPVLVRSARLTESDLAEIARSRGPAHMLAISGREALSEVVTDVLVERGDAEVAQKVAANSGARFSENGFAGLVARAKQDEELAEQVGQRIDIPPHLFRRLISEATDRVRDRLVAAASPDMRAAVQDLVSQISNKVSANPELASRKYSAARSYVKLLLQTGRLNVRELQNFARGGRFEEAVVALAELANEPLENVDRMLHGGSIEPLLVLCRSKDIDWKTVRAILLIRRGADPLGAKDLDRLEQDYKALSTSTAERVIRFSQIRQNRS